MSVAAISRPLSQPRQAGGCDLLYFISAPDVTPPPSTRTHKSRSYGFHHTNRTHGTTTKEPSTAQHQNHVLYLFCWDKRNVEMTVPLLVEVGVGVGRQELLHAHTHPHAGGGVLTCK